MNRNQVMYLLLMLLGMAATRGWASDNQFDGPLDFTCPHTYQAIKRFESVHDNHHEDRTFSLSCADIAPEVANRQLSSACFWSDYVNDYDQPVHFSCPTSHYISGMSSVHNDHHEDRIWKYYCCQTKGYHLLDCSRTGYLNDFDGSEDYSVPGGMVMKGADSIHNNHHEDRRYEFEICRIVEVPDEIIQVG